MNLNLFRRKDGKLAVEYIAIIVLALAVLLIMILFSDKVRKEIIDAITTFFSENLRGR